MNNLTYGERVMCRLTDSHVWVIKRKYVYCDYCGTRTLIRRNITVGLNGDYKPDGKRDGEIINRAINEASRQDSTVHILPGIYYLDQTITVPNGVWFTMTGCNFINTGGKHAAINLQT